MLKDKPQAPKRIDLTREQIEGLLKRVEERKLEEGDWEIIKGIAETITFMSQVLDEKSMSIGRLLKIVFGSSTESKKNILGTKF